MLGNRAAGMHRAGERAMVAGNGDRRHEPHNYIRIAHCDAHALMRWRYERYSIPRRVFFACDGE